MATRQSSRKAQIETDPTMSVDEAGNALGNVVLRADLAGERIILTLYGKPKAAVVSMDDLQRLQQCKCKCA